MLLSFGYKKASDTFARIAEKDPACAMACRGIATTYYHPIWEAPPGPADLKAGAAALEKARSVAAKTRRERDYIGAIGAIAMTAKRLAFGTFAARHCSAVDYN